MRRKTNFFLVAIDEDMTGYGYNGGTRAPWDVANTIVDKFLSAYNPKVVHLGSITRESNFTKDTQLPIDVNIFDARVNDDNTMDYFAIHQGGVDLHYQAEQPTERWSYEEEST